MISNRALLATLALTGIGASQQMSLSFSHTIDISAAPLQSAGDLAFDRDLERLYICDGANNGQIFQIDPLNGAVLAALPASTIPGLAKGPDALAISRGGWTAPSDLYVFSSFGESRGGLMRSPNTLLADFGTSHDATGADTAPGGALWVASGTASGGGTTLLRLNVTTGVIAATRTIPGVTERALDIAFDPWFGGLWILHEGGVLRRVDLQSGTTLETFDLNTLVSGLNTSTGGIAFNLTGTLLYVARNTGSIADSIVVLDRQLTTTACAGDGTGAACPCGNTGSSGRGCGNSVNAGGALLSGFGNPLVINDSFQLRVEGLPNNAACLFFQGTTVLSPALPFGDGLRCVGGSVIRLTTKFSVNGATLYPSTLEEDISSRGQVPAAGGTRHYQVWYRNAATFCTASTFNLSNGLTVEWR